MRKKLNFVSSLFSGRDWFETRFVGNTEDRFSRVVACVACSTALGQIFQVQQIIILKQIKLGGCSSDCALHCLIGLHKSFVTTPTEPENGGALISWLQVSGMTLC